MSASLDSDHPDLVADFGEQAYYHLIYTLRRGLPPLPDADPEAIRRREHAAIARIAAMVPANPTEADTAALYVAASEQWKHCLYLAQLPETSPKSAMQCRNQANAMMRQAQGALRLLLRMQAVREKRESTNQSCDRAAFTEYWNTNMMAEALASQRSSAEPPPASAADIAATTVPASPATAEQGIILPPPAAQTRRKQHRPADASFGLPTNGLPTNGMPMNGMPLIAAGSSGIFTLAHRATKADS